jgi:C4-dicarboxylate-specific signal transduction histidine kinase
VCANGIGIPPEHREKLFQPFTVWLSIPLLLLSGLFIGQAVIALLGCAVGTICQ